MASVSRPLADLQEQIARDRTECDRLLGALPPGDPWVNAPGAAVRLHYVAVRLDMAEARRRILENR